MPRSPFRILLGRIRSPRGKAREKVAFDEAPACCKVGVGGGQCPNRVKMVGQHDDGVDRERVVRPRVTKRRAQRFDVVRQQAPAAVVQVSREE
jgi:hypothetical protein